jgi:hypothetical protein
LRAANGKQSGLVDAWKPIIHTTIIITVCREAGSGVIRRRHGEKRCVMKK